MWRSEHFNCCFIRKWGITPAALLSRYQNAQANYTLKDFYSDSNRELEVERPPDHAICPLLRYFKPMKPVRYVYFNEEMVLFSGSE